MQELLRQATLKAESAAVWGLFLVDLDWQEENQRLLSELNGKMQVIDDLRHKLASVSPGRNVWALFTSSLMV